MLNGLSEARRITAAVAKYTSIPESEIMGQSHLAEVVAARHLTWWATREITELGWLPLERVFGYDHTTILGAVKKFRKRIAMNVALRTEAAVLLANLREPVRRNLEVSE